MGRNKAAAGNVHRKSLTGPIVIEDFPVTGEALHAGRTPPSTLKTNSRGLSVGHMPSADISHMNSLRAAIDAALVNLNLKAQVVTACVENPAKFGGWIDVGLVVDNESSVRRSADHAVADVRAKRLQIVPVSCQKRVCVLGGR
ncbi:hypothetical protein HRbin30_03240 [bacterium HR30]|nr:hypothetical protein HRbin30_03240 [bacterium HR30]